MAPWQDVGLLTDPESGFVVSLWNRYESEAAPVPEAARVAGTRRDLHRSMARIAVPLPSVRAAVGPAELVASRDEPLAAPAPDDGVLLRRSRAELTHRLDDRTHPEQPLHGEPHAGNCVRTRDGIRWIGIEGACGGPFGWDLAFVSHETRAEFGGIDRSPLDLLLSLGIACGATWCRVRARFPGMRRHGEHHLSPFRSTLS